MQHTKSNEVMTPPGLEVNRPPPTKALDSNPPQKNWLELQKQRPTLEVKATRTQILEKKVIMKPSAQWKLASKHQSRLWRSGMLTPSQNLCHVILGRIAPHMLVIWSTPATVNDQATC